MERRRLGKTDMTVSVLGFGGSEIGYEGATPETVTTLLHRALDAGLNVIDTAECYVNSEALIGQAVAARRTDYYDRSEVTVMRVGGKIAIDATKPPLWRKKEREEFSRVKPKGADDPAIEGLLRRLASMS